MSLMLCHSLYFQVDEVKPYRQERDQGKAERNQRKQLDAEDKAQWQKVEYKSMEDLEHAIKALQDRQAHEVLSKQEEERTIKEIARLEV